MGKAGLLPESPPSPPLATLQSFAAANAVASEQTAPSNNDSASAPSLDPTAISNGLVVSTTPLLAFLQRVQSAVLQSFSAAPASFDPKLYVDLPLKHDLRTTEAAFDALPRHGPCRGCSIVTSDLDRFLDGFFSEAGSDLVPATPRDFVPEPQGFLLRVEHPEVRAWALKVHSIWRDLCRRVSPDVPSNPERHTLLPLPNDVVVPGSRFREVYYWDSYWIVRGLLASKMYDTAKGVVRNLLSLVDAYGYVLNGARAYYTNRSQPPLLSSMVRDVYARSGDVTFVEQALPALVKEHRFWISGVHKVIIKDGHGREHSLSRYYAMWNKPRPETATIDEETAASILDPLAKEDFYRELASTAESGWDFSSRWMSDPSDFTTLSTTSVLPVDLNAFVLKMELDIAYLADVIGDEVTSREFDRASRARLEVFNSVFWSSEMNQWVDYWIPEGRELHVKVHRWDARNQSRKVFASNFVPIWILTLSSDHIPVDKVVTSFLRSGLLQANGIATSLQNTGQQWDFPNGWAPLQHMIAEGLARSGSESARILAEDIVSRWIRTNYLAYKNTGAMHEKYDVAKNGMAGGGGEYEPQTGFGWSNGVVLAFLEDFGWLHDKEINSHGGT